MPRTIRFLIILAMICTLIILAPRSPIEADSPALQDAAWPAEQWQWQHGAWSISSIHFVNANTGWAVGDAGLILHTQDGGQRWQPQYAGVTQDLFDVQFIDANTGWAIGKQNIILHTADGGQAWQSQTTPLGATDLAGLFFLDALNGWVGLADGVLKTTDGGATWVKTGSGIAVPVRDVQFFDADNGVLVTNDGQYDGQILLTSDGGANWDSATCHATFDCANLWALHFPTPNLGIAVGGWVNPKILRSTDGGATWAEISTSHNFIVPKTVHFIDDQYGWTGGVGSGSDGLLRTTDGGLTWSKQSPDAADVQMLSRAVGYRANGVGVYRTDDGGATWSLPDSFDYSYTLYDVNFVAATPITSTMGWAVGMGYTAGGYRSLILHTTNGGENWDIQRQGNEGLWSLKFVNATHGWAVGPGGAIRATTDGGVTWQNQTAGTDYYLHDVHFVDTLYGWIAGEEMAYENPDGKVWRTTDGGATWVQVAFFSGVNQGAHGKDGIDFVDRSTGYVVGMEVLNGSIHKSTDGGLTWRSVLGGAYPRLWAVDFINVQEGWAVGADGIILHTRNGGSSWEQQASPASVTLNAVAFVNSQVGYAAGGSYILKTTNGGQTWTAEPDAFLSGKTMCGLSAPTPYHVWAVGSGSTIRAWAAADIPPLQQIFLPLAVRQ